MSFTLPDLPYGYGALEPHISRRTLEIHHDKHHNGYVEKLNKLLADSDYDEGMDLADVIAKSRQRSDTSILNNAAQAWHHAFLWYSMSPAGGGDPDGELKSAIVNEFGDMDEFRTRFRDAAMAQFGSGWAWLVHDGNKLEILKSSNADTPVATGRTPLLTVDVWEHAYYLDYQNERKRYVDAFLDELVNWEFAASRYGALKQAA
jgi:Fe-Mn family superoxide dismutase